MARTNLGSLSFVGLWVTLQISSIYADSNVHIRSGDNLLSTSNTLAWLPISKHEDSSNEIVTGGGFQTENDLSGIFMVGQQIDGEKKCTVAHPKIKTFYDNYDLLENVDRAARLSWVAWDKEHKIPPGTVAVGDVFIARHVVNETENEGKNLTYTHFIGAYVADGNLEQIKYINHNGNEDTADSGEVLVETKPTFYELNTVRLNHNKKSIRKRSPCVLRETNFMARNNSVESAVYGIATWYTFNYSMFWGQGQAMSRWLNTSITLADGRNVGYIAWGVEENTVQSKEMSVCARLEPGTALNFTLRANYVEMEVPYTAELVSVYADNETKTRMISGIFREETIMDLKKEFGPAYYLSNMSLVLQTDKNLIDNLLIVPSSSTCLTISKSSLALIALWVIAAYYRIT